MKLLTILAKGRSQIIDCIQNLPQQENILNTDISLTARRDCNNLTNSLHSKFRSVKCLSLRWPLKQLSKVPVQWNFQEYLFGKVSVSYYQSICWRLKFYAFSIFFCTSLDRCTWSMEIILGEVSCFRHSKRVDVAAWYHKILFAKSFDGSTLKLKMANPI